MREVDAPTRFRAACHGHVDISGDDPARSIGDRGEAGAEPVDAQADHERTAAAEDVADLAAGEHEHRHHQAVEGDDRLDGGHRGVEDDRLLVRLQPAAEQPQLGKRVDERVMRHLARVVGICQAGRTFQTFPVVYTRYTSAAMYAPPDRKIMSFVLANPRM